MPQVNPKRTSYPINNNAGNFTTIRLTTFAKYVEVVEDYSQNAGNQQGLQFYLLDPFTQSAQILPAGGVVAGAPPPEGPFVASQFVPAGQPQIKVGDEFYRNGRIQAPLGEPGSAGNVDVPGGTVTLGTPILQVRTNTANATNVIVTEYA